MVNSREQLDPIEEALLELKAADQAELFGRTQIDSRLPAAQRASCGSRRPVFRLLPVAAAVAMAIGVWTWMFSTELTALRKKSGASRAVVSDSPVEDQGSFFECFSGPTGGLSPICREQDYDTDRDGDVDLTDFGAYQLAYAALAP